jgi:hypothetical protein
MQSVTKVLSLVMASLGVAVVAPGCGTRGLPNSVPVSGTVLIDGKPLDQGTAQFAPDWAGGHLAIGLIGKGGGITMQTTKSAPGVVRGTYRIGIVSEMPYEFDPLRPPAVLPTPESFIPRRSSSVETSGLTVDATGPMRELLFELTSE